MDVLGSARRFLCVRLTQGGRGRSCAPGGAAGVGAWRHTGQAQHPHEPLHPLAVDRMALVPEVHHHAPTVPYNGRQVYSPSIRPKSSTSDSSNASPTAA